MERGSTPFFFSDELGVANRAPGRGRIAQKNQGFDPEFCAIYQ